MLPPSNYIFLSKRFSAVNSAIGAIMAITAVVSSLIIEQHQQAWLLDPIVAYVFTVFFALYGVWLVLFNLNLDLGIGLC